MPLCLSKRSVGFRLTTPRPSKAGWIEGRRGCPRHFCAARRCPWLPYRSPLSSRRTASAQNRQFSFAYDQPNTTGYGIVGDIFADKLKELSKGTMLIDQYPGAQLGQEPQVLQLVKAGDIDFCIISSANAATLSPQAGVMSLHFLFRTEDHLVKALADPQVSRRFSAMIDETGAGRPRASR